MTALLLDPIYQQHDPGPGHPESVKRLAAITQALTDSGIVGKTQAIAPRVATLDELALCHDRGYIATAKKDVESGLDDLSTGDTAICARSYDVAVQAAGGVLNAVDAVFAGKAKNAFCAVRPPGHHARPAQGMGFCLFNNIAIAARHAQQKHGAQKVAIVDWDVHHGNGTQDIFYEDGSVLFCSTHQSPLYPFTGHAHETGSGKGKGTTLNLPFPARTGMSAIGGAFTNLLLPAIDAFKPDLILISAGFDSRIDDPLGQFRLTDDDFVALTKLLLESAHTHCQSRLVSILEGGYNIQGLASAVTHHVQTLLG
ncbi:MAG: histone deacetylase [Prosthecobacter sp.]|uniref:histone deacetylase family protein n=1 Tax=Prosthecobacter sp. TaxID=1965333 RepID=UPI003BB0AD8F